MYVFFYIIQLESKIFLYFWKGKICLVYETLETCVVLPRQGRCKESRLGGKICLLPGNLIIILVIRLLYCELLLTPISPFLSFHCAPIISSLSFLTER